MKTIPPGVHVTYQIQRRTCGKPTCGPCKRGERHGDYTYIYYRVDGRLRSGYLGKTTEEHRHLMATQRHQVKVAAEGVA